jgi:hypothetical protein
MSRELSIIQRELQGKDFTVLRSDYSLFEKDLAKDCQKFLKSVVDTAKKQKQGNVILVAIIKE